MRIAVDDGIEIRHTHLDRVRGRTLRLVFKRLGATVPELGRQEGGVPDRGRIATADMSVHADGRRPEIVTTLHDVVTRKARNRAGRGQPRIEVQHLAKLDPGGGGWIVSRRGRVFR